MQASNMLDDEGSQLHWIDAVQEKRDMHLCTSAQRNHQPCKVFCVCHVFPDQLISFEGWRIPLQQPQACELVHSVDTMP